MAEARPTVAVVDDDEYIQKSLDRFFSLGSSSWRLSLSEVHQPKLYEEDKP